MFLGSSCIHPCIPNFVNTIASKYWTYFDQTFSFCAFWDKMCFKFWSQKVKVQGNVLVQHVGRCTFGVGNSVF